MVLNDLELLVLVTRSLPDPRSSKLQLQAAANPCISWQSHCFVLAVGVLLLQVKVFVSFFFFLVCKGTEKLSVKGTPLCLASAMTWHPTETLMLLPYYFLYGIDVFIVKIRFHVASSLGF